MAPNRKYFDTFAVKRARSSKGGADQRREGKNKDKRGCVRKEDWERQSKEAPRCRTGKKFASLKKIFFFKLIVKIIKIK